MVNETDSVKHIFPYDRIDKGSTVVLYCAGKVGQDYLLQIQYDDYCNVMCIVDQRYESIQSFCGVEVVSPDWLMQTDGGGYDYVVIATSYHTDAVLRSLLSMLIPEKKIISSFQYGRQQGLSALGEDVAVRLIFHVLGKRRFSYIDVGANDPYMYSNTGLFYLEGCRGINVEPNPDMYKVLLRGRPEDINLNFGVGVKRDVLPYYMFKSHGANTFSETNAQKWESKHNERPEILRIPVVPLNEIIEAHANSVWPDFLQIDVEGWDYDILESCDFSRNTPIVICCECEEDGVMKMDSLLDQKGFRPVHRTTNNSVYLRKDT